ncbi:hypothetical protein AGJ25_04850 [Cronobacter sakazakii]|nr:hypothetical protein [Cronobacter sakazakii]EGT5750186.1 hypothetical protein [Cronobacter sakazakii]
MFYFSDPVYFTFIKAQNEGYMVERRLKNELRFYSVIAHPVKFYCGFAKEIGFFLCSFRKDCKV